MMCFGFRSIKKNAIDHGVNEAVTATDLTCAEVNAKANACSMVVDTLQEYEPLEKYLLHLRRGEEISESYYQQFRNNSISIIDKMQEAMPDLYQIHNFCHGRWFSGAAADPVSEGKDEKLFLVPKLSWAVDSGFFDIHGKKNIISGTKKRRFPFDDLCTGTAGSKRRKAWRDRGIHAYGRHISRNLSIR